MKTYSEIEEKPCFLNRIYYVKISYPLKVCLMRNALTGRAMKL